MEALRPRAATMTGDVTRSEGFVVFAGQDWWYHGQAHCDFQIARHLAEDQPVLVVNSIGMRMPTIKNSDAVVTRITRKAKSTLRYLRRPEPALRSFWVMTPISVPVFSHPRLRRLNARLVGWQVRAATRLVLRMRRPTVIVVVPTALDVVRTMKLDVAVYYRADDHAATTGVDHKVIFGLESELLMTARLTAYSSQALLSAEAHRPRRNAVLLAHGVDVDHFDPAQTSAEPVLTASIPHPRVGFFGQIEPESIDLDLLVRIAEADRARQLVLIGRVAMDLSRLSYLNNVHVLGWQPYAELPALAARFDVAICPMPDTKWVESASPIKIKEYLALGLAVVTRDIPQLRTLANVLTLARTNDDFVAAIDEAIATGGRATPELRRLAVIGDTWRVRAQELRSALGMNRVELSEPELLGRHP
ncbi:MAG: glycosyltransferase [Ilumatobacteraceae bacterium]